MLSGSSWHKWRRTFRALLFIIQYHCRMSLLSLRYKLRAVSRTESDRGEVCSAWNTRCQALTTHRTLNVARRPIQRTPGHEQFTGLQPIKQALDHEQSTAASTPKKKRNHERLNAALRTAKKRLEQIIFIEETPAQPLDLSSLEKLKTAWRSFETSKIPRIDSERLKTAWHPFETGKLAPITPETLKAARHPLQTLKDARQRTIALIALGCIALLLITLFAVSGLAARVIHTIGTASISSAPQLISSELNPLRQRVPLIDASKALVRISQLDPSEYASQDEFNTWAYSACSTASMTEVFNAYGRHYRITDVLKVEASLGEITPRLGLTENIGIANTAAKFGFQTDWGNNWSLDQVLSNANAGRPVIVGWPPARYEGGHIVVVLGGDDNNIYLADSSLWDRTVLSRAQFMQWWAGFAAVVTPE
jgi:hypothetical protein